VLAIAITLLVLEISVPPPEFAHLWHGIWEERFSYLAYATSFLTIGGIWLFHHAIFRRIKFADPVVTRLNLFLLMAVAFLPFPTKLMAESLKLGDGKETAVLFYGANLLVIVSLLAGLGRYAAREQLAHDTATRDEVRRLSDRIAPSLGAYVLVVLLALFAPTVAVVGFLALAVLAVSRAH
jgi:uncharacterized membrane protein